MANPLYGQNKVDEVLGDLAKIFIAQGGGGGASLQLTHFEVTIAAASTTDLTLTDQMPASANTLTDIWGGYIEVSGISKGASVDFDIGHTAHLTIYQEAIAANGVYGLDSPSHQLQAEDVVVGITTNGSTTPIQVSMAFLSCIPVTS
jgi:hypothetical protein